MSEQRRDEEMHTYLADLVNAYKASIEKMIAAVESRGYALEQSTEMFYLEMLFYSVVRYTKLRECESTELYRILGEAYPMLTDYEHMVGFLETIGESIEDVERKEGSANSFKKHLYLYNQKVIGDADAEEITNQQIEALTQLLRVQHQYGLVNWKICGEKENIENPLKNSRNKRVEETALDAFCESANICKIYVAIKERIEEYKRKLDFSFNEVRAYEDWYEHFRKPKGDRLKLIVIGWGICFFLISSIWPSDVLVILSIIGAVCLYYLITKWDHVQADQQAKRRIAPDRLRYEELNREKTQWQRELSECSNLLDQVESTLRTLIPRGGVREKYWMVACQLWRLVEIGRADSLKEAVNVYEDMQWKISVMTEIERQNSEIAMLNDRLEQLQKEQDQMYRELNWLDFRQSLMEAYHYPWW